MVTVQAISGFNIHDSFLIVMVFMRAREFGMEEEDESFKVS